MKTNTLRYLACLALASVGIAGSLYFLDHHSNGHPPALALADASINPPPDSAGAKLSSGGDHPDQATSNAEKSTQANPTQASGSAKPPSVFGMNGPVQLDDVPAGRFHDELAGLNPAARQRALQKLGDMHVPLNDVASLHVDAEGQLFYECVAATGLAPAVATAPAGADALGAQAPVPIASPPVRHSRPGSANTIYLDFNGHTITGTAWNATVATYVAKAFDLDGDGTTFSDAEQSAIINIWERVSEDYRGFDVDVTTEAPATFTRTTGRVLITSNVDANGVNMPSSTAGGVAYVDVFGDTDYVSRHSPALVYINRLSNNLVAIAEASSHEMGHNLGLSHDGTNAGVEYYSGHGTGATSWAPIMGASYYANVTQWSKGEYYNANNLQDDLAIISAHVGYAADDHTDSNATATPLNVSGNNVSGGGVISKTGEGDRFAFATGAGAITLNAAAFRTTAGTGSPGGDLDVALQLYNSAGTLVAQANVDPLINATLNATVAAGTYYLRVSGAGSGNPLNNPPTGYTNYGSLGLYTVTGTIQPFNPLAPVITSPLTASGQVGLAFSYQITATNNPTSFSATGLPAGLTLNPSTGLISGLPTATGPSSVILGATNASGTGTATLSLTISGGTPLLAIDAGGPAAAPFVADAFFVGGNAANHPNAVSTAGVTNPAPLVVYQNERWGNSSYTLPGLAANAAYLVRLHFAETWFTGAAGQGAAGVGQRQFNVSINSQQVLANFDITAAAGGANRAVVKEFAATATAAGEIVVAFTAGAKDNAKIDGLEIVASGPPPVPVITSPAAASGTVGAPFSYQIAATNAPTGFSAVGLPGGLAVNTATGLISGTPTAAGTSSVTLGATNAGGTGNATLTLTVGVPPPPPVISSPPPATGQVGVPFSYQIVATNNPTSYSVTGLPPGLSFNATTGLISGIPTVAGTSTVTLNATNAGGGGSAALILTIAPAIPVITSALTASGQANTAFSYQIAATSSPTSFGATGLPSGLSVNTATGLISGTPAVGSTSAVTISATNLAGTGSATLTLTISTGVTAIAIDAGGPAVGGFLADAYFTGGNAANHPNAINTAGATNPAPLVVYQNERWGNSSYSIPGLVPNAAYLVRLHFAETWFTGAAGQGPAGVGQRQFNVSINGQQVLVNFDITAAAGGANKAVVREFNAAATAAGQIVVTFAAGARDNATINGIEVIAAGPLPAPVITSAANAIAQVGTAFSYQITATNNPTNFNATGLPAGLTVDTATGLISGTPTTGGNSTVTLSATNASGTGLLTLLITSGSFAIAIDAGGPAAGAFIADAYFTGGTAANHPNAIVTAGVATPAPVVVYQNERWGNSTYTIPGLAAGRLYLVRLHFAETWFTGAAGQGPAGVGQRQFNVSLNGQAVLGNFDITAAAGAANRAVVKEFNAVATAAGQVVVGLTAGAKDNATINGIEIIGTAGP